MGLMSDERLLDCFEKILVGLPLPMQVTIRDSMKRGESNSWSFFKAGAKCAEVEVSGPDYALARAIEAVHGITGATP